MDPLFMSYSQANGLPQESKLATYMSRATISGGDALKKPSANFVPSAGTNFLAFPRSNAEVAQPSPPPAHESPNTFKNLAAPIATYQENVGGTTYFFPSSGPGTAGGGGGGDEGGTGAVAAPLPAYHMYPGTPPHLAKSPSNTQPGAGSGAGFFAADHVRAEVLARNALVLARPDPALYPDLPTEIDTYHELCPLSDSDAQPNKVKNQLLGYAMSSYKATNMKDGGRYCLRRVHDLRLPNAKCMAVVDMWKRLRHTNIVQLREVFTTKAFGDHSMIFVYDYHPCSETLYAKHFASTEGGLNGYGDPFPSDPAAPRPYSHQKNTLLRRAHGAGAALPEPLIWSHVVQLTAALRAIHAAGLACRSLDPTKVILTSPARLRLSCLGIPDILTFDAANPMQLMPHYQQEDLTALGKLVLALACKSLVAVTRENIATSMELMARSYSADLRNLVRFLLSGPAAGSGPAAPRSVTDLMPMIGARFYVQLDALQRGADHLEDQLARELENGRLVRLMAKLNTINERPELHLDAAWSETGDRYMLKLFRDYVFHQITESGRPWLDMAHIVQCLNKLDAGSTEKVSLMSRDEQSVLVVSYSELKLCLEQSFQELLTAAKLDSEN